MNSNNALITEWNQKIDDYLEQEDYDRVEEICRKLCRIEGLEPADCMPENFLFQLKQKENATMNKKKTLKRISGIAAAAAVFLLIGGTVSAAVICNGNTHFFDRGLLVGDDMKVTSEIMDIVDAVLPESPGEVVITLISEEEGSADVPWISKSVWEETSESNESGDAAHWTKGCQTARITGYRYADYFTAVEDAGFDPLFTTNYTGEVLYYQYETLKEGVDTVYSISGDFAYGNGHFGIDQMAVSAVAVITTTGETANEREYISSAGIVFKLSDDTEFGYTKTTTVCKGKSAADIAVLEFVGMTEEEIHQVLDNVQLSFVVYLEE